MHRKNRLRRAEFVVQHASDGREERTDQSARQHEDAGVERAGAKRHLGQIGDDVSESDADDRQNQVRE